MSTLVRTQKRPSQWTPRQKMTMAVTGPITVVAGILFVAEAQWMNGNPDNAAGNLSPAGDVFGITGLIGFLAFCVFFYVLTKPWFNSLGENVRQAVTPLPSPFEIANQLRVQLGREPTIQEVESMHNMIVSHKREAQLKAAVGIGAIYEVGRIAERAKGHPSGL